MHPYVIELLANLDSREAGLSLPLSLCADEAVAFALSHGITPLARLR